MYVNINNNKINNDKINPKKSSALQCALQKYWKNIALIYINCYYISTCIYIYIYIYLYTQTYVLYNVYSINKYRCIDAQYDIKSKKYILVVNDR